MAYLRHAGGEINTFSTNILCLTAHLIRITDECVKVELTKTGNILKKKERIKELKELRQLLLHDLRMTNRIEQKIGNTPHLEEMRNLYLDQLNDINRELKKIK